MPLQKIANPVMNFVALALIQQVALLAIAQFPDSLYQKLNQVCVFVNQDITFNMEVVNLV